MPNRVLRDWTDSEKIDQLSFQAEILFTRLFMKADDFGSFYAHPKLLRAQLFPLRLSTVKETDIVRWLAECERAALLIIYEVAGKRYLRIINFGQRLRSMRSRFPAPSLSNDSQLQQPAADGGGLPPDAAKDGKLPQKTANSSKPPPETEEKQKQKQENETDNEGEGDPPPPLNKNFLKSFFEPEHAADREAFCLQCGIENINNEWAEVFNAFLITERKKHKNYKEWLSHFRNWLPVKLPELKKMKHGNINDRKSGHGKIEVDIEL